VIVGTNYELKAPNNLQVFNHLNLAALAATV
jgi:hypothetical protein